MFMLFVMAILLSAPVILAIALISEYRAKRKRLDNYRPARAIPTSPDPTVPTPTEYAYRPRQSIMTKTEQIFLAVLRETLADTVEIVPQAHISSILDHKLPGQNWKIAFAKINGKSVDFLICKKHTYQPLLAIELDDRSHQTPDRITRDRFVNNIFKQSGIPLIRIVQGEWESVANLKAKIQSNLPATANTPQ